MSQCRVDYDRFDTLGLGKVSPKLDPVLDDMLSGRLLEQ